ncbi:hypothetical protein OUZ56_033089 [Daphnia magna]|uniref:Uncharacterized protein n=1 Tax=Daphnia magna TaxID=35525 RepID=A0ABR0BAI2_9CRUS|nr:hypothetical protein OUZ56_033089 [Daphnia magna]
MQRVQRRGRRPRHGEGRWQSQEALRGLRRPRPGGGGDRRSEAAKSAIHDVDRVTHRVHRRFHHPLAEGRVGVDGEADVVEEGRHLVGERPFGDEVGRRGADDVDPEDLLVGVGDDLDEAGGFADGEGAGERRERELADLDREPLLLALLLGEADGRDLRIGEDGAGDADPVLRRLVAGDDFCNDFALFARLVGEHRLAADVADRPDVGDVRAADDVARDEAPLDLDADLFEAEAGAVRAHADGDEDDVADDLLGLSADFDVHGDRAVGVLHVAERLGALEELRAVLRHLALDDGGDVGIDAGEHLIGHFNDGQFGAETLVDAAEFEANDTAADDDEALRDLGEADRLFGADDLRAVELEGRDFDGRRAGRDDDVLRREALRGAVGRTDFNGVFVDNTGISRFKFDAVAAEEAADAAGHLLDDAGLPLLHLRRLDGDRPFELEPHRPGDVELFVGVARRDERLRGDAAPVQTDAADFLFFHTEDLQLQLAKADRADVPAGTAANDDGVVGFVAGQRFGGIRLGAHRVPCASS